MADKTALAAAFKSGHTLSSPNLSLKYIDLSRSSTEQKNQYCFVVSAKVSRLAVVRNILKRRARHIIRKNQSRIRTSFVCLFLFKPGAAGLSFMNLEKEIVNLLSRARIV